MGFEPHNYECFARREAEPILPQDRSKDQDDELIKINLANEGEEAQTIFLRANLIAVSREKLLDLLKEFKDVFHGLMLRCRV